MTSEIGFCYALFLILSAMPGAMLLAGFPCSMWIFLSSSYHQRTKDNVEGNTDRFLVRQANCQLRNTVVLMRIAVETRGLIPLLEQPASSISWHLKCMADLLSECGFHRIFTHMGAFLNPLAKPSVFWTLLSEGPRLMLTYSWNAKRGVFYHPTTIEDSVEDFIDEEEVPFSKPGSKAKTFKVYYSKSGGWITGGKNLKESGIYTTRFSEVLYTAWLNDPRSNAFVAAPIGPSPEELKKALLQVWTSRVVYGPDCKRQKRIHEYFGA